MTLLLLALKITVVFGLAGLASLALRRARAAARHYVWGLALTAALLLPAVTLIGPRVALPVLPADTPEVAVPAGAVSPDAVAQVSDDDAAAPPVTPAPSVPGTPAAAAAVPWPAMIWGGGAAAILVLIGVSVLATVRLGRRGRPVMAGTMVKELDDARVRLGIRRPVRLLLGDARAMPMTWGSVRPVVLLPAAAIEWSPARRRDVLLHELAHVRRFDWLSQLGARVVCAVYWWHPLAWYAARRLREERELACDDLVLAHGARAEDYAHHLLEIARGLQASRRTALAGVAMARPSQLAGRLLAVLDGSRQRAGLTRGHAGTAAAVAAAILLPVAGLTAVAAGPDKAADKTKDDGAAVAWTPTARPAAAPASAQTDAPRLTLCNWSDLGDARSSHSNIDDDRVTITIIVDRCELSVRSRGLVRFTDDERDVAELGMDSWFAIEERAADGTRRRAEFDRRTSQLVRRWYVDGREQPWDAAAATWFQGALQVAFRRTSFQARERAARIYQRGGGQALLAEVERLYSSSAIMAYLELYADQETLTSDEARRIARLARARITSSSNLSRVLRTLLRNPGIDDAARADIIEASTGIASSSARAEVLVAASEYATLTPALADAVLQSSEGISSSSARGRVLSYVGTRLPADQPLPSSYVSAARSISSSSVQAEVLVALLERDGITTAQLNAVLEIAGAIGSSSARARVLKTFLARNGVGPATGPAFFRALHTLGSSSERGEILRALAMTGPDAATVGDMLDAAGNVSSSSERAEVLVAVARADLLTTDALRNQYLRVANSISSRSARERALRAVGAI